MTPFLSKVILVSIILDSQSNPDSDVRLLYVRKYLEHYVYLSGPLVFLFIDCIKWHFSKTCFLLFFPF